MRVEIERKFPVPEPSVEVELESMAADREFDQQRFVPEVTDDPRFANRSLAQTGGPLEPPG